ncbi:neuronal PAS domain-containing protein 2-like [Coccinella septempunctata]|uniref:Juvenile hormone methoprene-tolerant n=1 Tax=Coccinella septempunctata TaxID=41139 RepID=A0AA50Q9I0_COCSE|nr:neuronal PAS domain-containing protein 2-like [Coccinella septempunctata]WMB96349.1 juvenile hormone methoprene-tolerant [Coccinella septempunctata]
MLISRNHDYLETSKMSIPCRLQPDHNPPSNSREMRNKAEKLRRDKLNSYIGELAKMVPMVAKSSKRMDKTSILRLSASHLRIYHTLMNGKVKLQIQMPHQVDQCMLEQIVYNELGGFLMVLDANAKIMFVSPTVENLLGYLQTDLMGQSIYNVTLQMDHEILRRHLIISNSTDENCNRDNFMISLKRAAPRSEMPVYERVRVMSVFKSLSYTTDYDTATLMEVPPNTVGNDIWLLFIRMNRPEKIPLRMMESSKDEYYTRHLVDGRIVCCDQRISLIAGYFTDEVFGISAFKFMHLDDVRWVIIALRQMYDRGETKGTSCYRLLSRNSKYIYLRTSGFLEYDSHGTVESFLCYNSLVDETEGKRLIEEMKRRYSAYVNTNYLIPGSPNTPIGAESLEEPLNVEQAIKHLIMNLPSSPCSTPSPKLTYTDEKEDCDEKLTEISTDNKVIPKTVLKRPPCTNLDANLPIKRLKNSPYSMHNPPLTFKTRTDLRIKEEPLCEDLYREI